ncbi:MAG: sortase [Pseudonocardiaceae bacterium]
MPLDTAFVAEDSKCEGERDAEATFLVSTGWEVPVPREPSEDSGPRHAVDHAGQQDAVAVPEEERAADPPPVQRGGHAALPAAETASGHAWQYRLASHVLTIVALLSLSFLVELTLLGGLRHDRDQAENLERLRQQLAEGVAPVAPVDEANRLWASGTPVAILEIPRLGLREVVVEGTSSGTLRSGPGHRRDTVLPGQVGTSVILGRLAAYGGPFGSIDQLRTGDEVVATTGQGRHVYRVLGVRRAGDPLPPPPPAAGQGRLTLTTADGPAHWPTDVLRIDAQLTSPPQPTPAQLPSRSLPANEAAGVGDTSALFAVVLWSAALVTMAVGTVWVRYRTGLWQAWVIGVPVLATLGLGLFDELATLLPNLA